MADDTAPPKAEDVAPKADSDAPVEDVQPDEVDTTGFVGVDPMYQNYARDTDKPGVAEEGPEKYLEQRAAAIEEDRQVRNANVGVTGYSRVDEPEERPKDRVSELRADARRKAAQTKELDKQRKVARENRVGGQQV